MSFNPDKAMRTRDGREVELIAKDIPAGDGRSLVVLIKDDVDFVTTRFPNGSLENDKFTRREDLVNVPQKYSGWVNVFPKHKNGIRDIRGIYNTKNEADRFALAGRVTCLEIEWEEK